MATLQQFRTAWADKANRDAAFAIAAEYVAENEATYGPILDGKSSDELVTIIDMARAAGNQDMVTIVTMWELVKFERREIGGTVRSMPQTGPRLRVVKE